MKTSAKIILKNLYGDESEAFVAGMYCPTGGAPRLCGKRVAQAARLAALTPGEIRYGVEVPVLNNRNWAQHFLRALCDAGMDLQFLDEKQLDSYIADYVYTVVGEYDDFDCVEALDADGYLSRLSMECFSRAKDAPVFLGAVKPFSDWCETC